MTPGLLAPLLALPLAFLAGACAAPAGPRVAPLFHEGLDGVAARPAARTGPAAAAASAAATSLAPAPAGAWHATPPPPAAPRALPSPPAARERMLRNGLRVVVVEHRARPVVLVSLVLPRGTLVDPPDAAGATSLAVQLATDFREKDDAGERIPEEKSLRQVLGEMGGTLDTGAGQDASWFRVTGYAADVGAYLELLAGAVRDPRHGEFSWTQRRNGRLDFLDELRSSDDAALGRVIASAAFGEGHPYGRSPIGTRESLEKMGLEDVIRHQAELLVPEGATLLVVGDVDAAAVLDRAGTAFRPWAGRVLPAPAVSSPLPGPARPMGVLRRVPSATLVACATRPLGDVATPAAEAALEVLAALLGGGPTSRLAAALREGNGHAYEVGAHLEHRRRGSAFLACARLSSERAADGLRVFRDTLSSVRAAPPSAVEVARARGSVEASLEAAWDDAIGAEGAWLEALVRGEQRPDLARRRAAVEAVTAADLARLARDVLRPESLHWVVSGDPKAAREAARQNGMATPVVLKLQR